TPRSWRANPAPRAVTRHVDGSDRPFDTHRMSSPIRVWISVGVLAFVGNAAPRPSIAMAAPAPDDDDGPSVTPSASNGGPPPAAPPPTPPPDTHRGDTARHAVLP